MVICKECGVELDADMAVCPLCNTPVYSGAESNNIHHNREVINHQETRKKHLLQRVLWQVTSVLLLSVILATLVIDWSIHKTVTWSVYPISICMIIFSYALLVALWHAKIVFQLTAGWVVSSGVLIVLNLFLSEVQWILQLALPILSSLNIVGISMIIIFSRLKTQGLNILAITFVAIAIECLIVDGIVSKYFEKTVRLQWSIIVAACLVPVTAVLLFMYFRTRNNPNLQKIFHT